MRASPTLRPNLPRPHTGTHRQSAHQMRLHTVRTGTLVRYRPRRIRAASALCRSRQGKASVHRGADRFRDTFIGEMWLPVQRGGAAHRGGPRVALRNEFGAGSNTKRPDDVRPDRRQALAWCVNGILAPGVGRMGSPYACLMRHLKAASSFWVSIHNTGLGEPFAKIIQPPAGSARIEYVFMGTPVAFRESPSLLAGIPEFCAADNVRRVGPFERRTKDGMKHAMFRGFEERAVRRSGGALRISTRWNASEPLEIIQSKGIAHETASVSLFGRPNAQQRVGPWTRCPAGKGNVGTGRRCVVQNRGQSADSPLCRRIEYRPDRRRQTRSRACCAAKG